MDLINSKHLSVTSSCLMLIVTFYKNYLFCVSFPLCTSSALCVLSEGDDAISQGPEEQAAWQGKALHEPRQDQCPQWHQYHLCCLRTSPRYSPHLHIHPAATAFSPHLSYAQTHANMQIFPLMTETTLRYMYLYVDIHLAIYKGIRRAEWWKSEIRQESGLPVWSQQGKVRSGHRCLQHLSGKSLSAAQPPAQGQHMHEWSLGEASHSPFS